MGVEGWVVGAGGELFDGGAEGGGEGFVFCGPSEGAGGKFVAGGLEGGEEEVFEAFGGEAVGEAGGHEASDEDLGVGVFGSDEGSEGFAEGFGVDGFFVVGKVVEGGGDGGDFGDAGFHGADFGVIFEFLAVEDGAAGVAGGADEEEDVVADGEAGFAFLGGEAEHDVEEGELTGGVAFEGVVYLDEAGVGGFVDFEDGGDEDGVAADEEGFEGIFGEVDHGAGGAGGEEEEREEGEEEAAAHGGSSGEGLWVHFIAWRRLGKMDGGGGCWSGWGCGGRRWGCAGSGMRRGF